jgi:predicted SnoaL-like aldol condensation-catalyzing enzyme
MVEMKIDASELKGEGGGIIEKFADFLKEKTSAEVSIDSKTIVVKGEGEAVSKKYLRIMTKKFLHKRQLTDTFRVIADHEENTLKVKERKIYED